ncbi:hypothetical protein R1sor_014892 [Riccia sorocarpa]|uniref:Copper transport protein n=1 Tax=Riccia sorocarpa TaxID=122646 RepID=A0ABD3HB59_9MARC
MWSWGGKRTHSRVCRLKKGKMMHMTFYWGTKATLLFDEWVTKTPLQYYLSLLGIIIFAVVHEWLFTFRVRLASKKGSPRADGLDRPLLDQFPKQKSLAFQEGLVALLYGVNASTGYLLMLLVMSFNGGVFIAVVVGLVNGYAFFRSKTGPEDTNQIADPCCVG